MVPKDEVPMIDGDTETNVGARTVNETGTTTGPFTADAEKIVIVPMYDPAGMVPAFAVTVKVSFPLPDLLSMLNQFGIEVETEVAAVHEKFPEPSSRISKLVLVVSPAVRK